MKVSWKKKKSYEKKDATCSETGTGKINILSNHVVLPKISASDYNNKERYPNKQQFCIFCEKLVNRFGRHLTGVHKHEKAIMEILILPLKSLVRKKKIDALRCKGNYQYNHSKNSTSHIVARRCHRKNQPNEYTDCPSCFMRVSKLSLRRHYRKCN